MFTPLFNRVKKFRNCLIPRPSRLRNIAVLYGSATGATPVAPAEGDSPASIAIPRNKLDMIDAGAYFVRDGYLQHLNQQKKTVSGESSGGSPAAPAASE